jgi:DNA-binding transcriptional ArsR family regulator
MQDVLYIDDVDQAAALLKPVRIELLKRMVEPTTCSSLAEQLGETPQKLYYHVKTLERAGLVEKVDERRVGGIMEGLYQAAARAFWLSPRLVGQIGGRQRVHDDSNLGYLLGLAEELQQDIGLLSRRITVDAPSLGLSAQIELNDAADREAFMQEVQGAIQQIAERYGARDAADRPADPRRTFRLMVACYPQPDESPS